MWLRINKTAGETFPKKVHFGSERGGEPMREDPDERDGAREFARPEDKDHPFHCVV